MRYNEYNQPIGDAVENYEKGEWPEVSCLEGKTVRVEKLNIKHASDMYEYFGPKSNPTTWTYIPLNQYNSYDVFENFVKKWVESRDPYYFSIIDKATEKVVGTIALMHIVPENRTIEMGWVIYSDFLRKTRQATEAQYLVMKYVFEDLKYRRYEWECDHLNTPSHNAAVRLGFTYEGTFRNAMVYKNRTRDTDWHSIIESEWERKKERLQRWLSDDNFDENGQQKQGLSSME
uniref:Acetyltransferase n=1 Tax=Piromyces sp. TaxID=45796 RepID=A0A2S1TYX0_PIRSP|nr:Acetyltransferase [Piromyces sp.]